MTSPVRSSLISNTEVIPFLALAGLVQLLMTEARMLAAVISRSSKIATASISSLINASSSFAESPERRLVSGVGWLAGVAFFCFWPACLFAKKNGWEG